MRRALLVAATLLLAACGSLPPDLDGDRWEMPPRGRKFARLSSEVPAFGGLAHTEVGWTVFTRDATRETDAANAVSRIFSEAGDETFTIGVRPARGGGSEQLKTRAGNAVGSIETIVGIDYDETTGYVRIGFHDPDAIDMVEDALTGAQLPLDLTILEVDYPVLAL